MLHPRTPPLWTISLQQGLQVKWVPLWWMMRWSRVLQEYLCDAQSGVDPLRVHCMLINEHMSLNKTSWLAFIPQFPQNFSHPLGCSILRS